jgi:beta-lactamase class D
MKPKILILVLIANFLSCAQEKKKNDSVQNIEQRKLQTILDFAKVNGVILIFDYQQNKYYSNDFLKAKDSVLPASTFKIPNSIIGLETGILKNQQTVFKWNGNERAFSIWEKDLSLKEAFQKSCVPCYQELALKIGTKRMIESLKKLKFGKMDVNNENIDTFWLIGKSKINPFQQIDFLNRLYNKQLQISKQTNETIRKIMIIEQNKNYVLSGKTGLTISAKKETGWFVGYIEKEEKTFYFATKIISNENDMQRNKFSSLRKEVTILALKKLKIIE